jgi:DNA-binding CsgD family transcriptional regulator
MLEHVQTEINALRHLHGDNQTPQVLYLNTLANSTILTEQDWEDFSKLFDKVHTGFFVRLKEKYPNITPAETRLLCLTKLNLSTKEMAGMLGVSTDAIKKTRQRLRKKMEVDEEKNLEELVAVL